MTTITPPTSPQPPPSTSAPVPIVVVQSPPPALARLVIGQLLEATVTSQTAKDVFQVKTPLGQLSIQSGMALPKDGALVLQLQSRTPTFQFQISSINGAAPPHALRVGKGGGLTSQAQGAGTTGTAQGQGQSVTTVKLALGNVLQATVLRPLSQPVGTPNQLAGAPSSSTAIAAGQTAGKGALAGQTDGPPPPSKPLTPPASAMAKATTPPASGRAIGAAINQGIPKAAPGIASQASGYLPSGSHMSVKVTGIQLPNPSASRGAPAVPGAMEGSTTLKAGSSLRGTVTGSTPSGHPIVQTRAGVIALTTQTVVPRGSVVTFDVVTPPTPPTLKPGVTPSLHETLFTSRKWPALEQVFQVIQEANPATAQQLIHSIVPRPDAGLTAGMIFFLSALRAGDLRSWIGDAPMRLIERTRPMLGERISDDFSSLVRMADEPTSGDWRVALIPINTGAQIEQIRLLLRQNANEEEEEDGPSDTRFIVDVELSSFGRVQLDGLVRNNGKSLDLIIRSESPLDATMHNDIRTIFQQTADLTGLKGGVNFQAAPPDFIDIRDPSGDHDLGLVV